MEERRVPGWNVQRHHHIPRLSPLQRPELHHLPPTSLGDAQVPQHRAGKSSVVADRQAQKGLGCVAGAHIGDAVDEDGARDHRVRDERKSAVPALRQLQQELRVELVAKAKGVHLQRRGKRRVQLKVLLELGHFAVGRLHVGHAVGEHQHALVPATALVACPQRVQPCQHPPPEIGRPTRTQLIQGCGGCGAAVSVHACEWQHLGGCVAEADQREPAFTLTVSP